MNEIVARFTASQAAQLVGLPQRTLRYWVRHNVMAPVYYDDSGWLGYRYFFSFRDLIALRTLRVLREHNVPMAKIRIAAAFLQKQYERPWSDLRLWLYGREFVFDDPHGTELVSASRSGQKLARELVEIEPLVLEMRAKVAAGEKRSPEEIGTFTRTRSIMGGQLVVAGTRIQPSTIWSYHRAEYTDEQIQNEFPMLELRDIHAAIEYERARYLAPNERQMPSKKLA